MRHARRLGHTVLRIVAGRRCGRVRFRLLVLFSSRHFYCTNLITFNFCLQKYIFSFKLLAKQCKIFLFALNKLLCRSCWEKLCGGARLVRPLRQWAIYRCNAAECGILQRCALLCRHTMAARYCHSLQHIVVVVAIGQSSSRHDMTALQ